MGKVDIETLIVNLRNSIKDNYDKMNSEWYVNYMFNHIDEFINSPHKSELEKAFYLLLNQYPNSNKKYIVIPNERVLIPDIYDLSRPGFEYEIDFAIYGGSINNPVKVAIECDGIRSHSQKHSNKDRRKDVNLQVAGWLVMRFGSKEIHEELERIYNDKGTIFSFLDSIENTITEKLKLIDEASYSTLEFKSKLTGYKWGMVTCEQCGHVQSDILNHKNIICLKCNTKFKRKITSDEGKSYDYNGILHYEN